MKLYSVSNQYRKHGRLKGMYTALSDFCQTNNKNAEDVLFSMLSTTLQDNGKAELAKKVDYLWTEQVANVLSVDECLAIRIDLLQTKNMYKNQCDFLNNKGQFVYKPLYSLNQMKRTYFPSRVTYTIKDNNGAIVRTHIECTSQPINLMSDFREGLPQFLCPNVVGTRWDYRDAVAKFLRELGSEIDKGLENLGITDNPLLHVLIKDGGDGLGDVSQYKEKGDTFIEDKAYRYSFCILKITIKISDESIAVWEVEAPGSLRTNKTLIEAVCDENQTLAMVTCVIPIEREHEQISHNLLDVKIENNWRTFNVTFINSMEDEKRARSDGGLQGRSRFLCDLCYATQETAKSELDTFKICCTLEETRLLICSISILTN